MIIFSGKISNANQHFITCKRGKQVAIMGLMVCLLALIIGIPFALITKDINSLWGFILCGCLILLLCAYLFILADRKKIAIEWELIIKISNEEIQEILAHSNYSSRKQKLSKVKKVIDYGEFYYICFNRWDASNGIICQRDLIVEGTLEEFEKIFDGKIIKKPIKK